MLNLDNVLSGLLILLLHAKSGDLLNFERVAIAGRDCKDLVDIHFFVVVAGLNMWWNCRGHEGAELEAELEFFTVTDTPPFARVIVSFAAITRINSRKAAPPAPKSRIFIEPMKSLKDVEELVSLAAKVKLHLINLVLFTLIFFLSSHFCSKISIRWCEKWTSSSSLDLRVMDEQLIFVDCSLHVTGNLSRVWAEIVQLNENHVLFVGHDSVTFRFPSSPNSKSSNSASVEGDDVALTEEWMRQVLPTT